MESKGQWGSNFGFLMAAVGSAVGLGNLWGFPYKIGANGGFAFLLIYLILALFIGFVIMLGELAIGRNSGKGVIAAYETLNKKYAILGWMGFICPFLIMSFYCMLGGYVMKYAIANLGDVFNASWGVNGADSGEYFTNFFTNQLQTSIYSVIFVALTMLVIMKGVSEGIEKFSKIAMPALFFLLLIVIIRSVTLPGAIGGLEFMFKPNFEVFKGTGWISVLSSAGGQMFFSLSLGMGIMITYGSYINKNMNLERNAILIPVADTIIAIMAGLAIMPAVFATGMEPGAGPGLLFITLQSVFDAMGGAGPIFGFLFYVLVFIAAITSSISLFEVTTSSVIDKMEQKGKTANRVGISLVIGIIVTALSIFVSLDGLGSNGFPQIFGQGCWLDTMDLLSEGIMMPLGALVMSLLLGWKIGPDWLEAEITANGDPWKTKSFAMFCFKFIAPLGMAFILAGQISNFFGLGWF